MKFPVTSGAKMFYFYLTFELTLGLVLGYINSLPESALFTELFVAIIAFKNN
jgi:hypothetical protein